MSKRRFFQIHLSTAVVLMLVAGVLVWANVRERIKHHDSDDHIYHAQGWPTDCRRVLLLKDDKTWRAIFLLDQAFFNAVIALAILLSVCVACEWRIRRRAARKANE